MTVSCNGKKNKSDKDSRSSESGPPKYQYGVLEEGWQFRSRDEGQTQSHPHSPEQAQCQAIQRQQSLPPFKGCSVYKTSYRSPPLECYASRPATWQDKSANVLDTGDKDCYDNFTTTSDLVYRILPQLCPRLREYNTSALEWFPAQDFLPCYGNLTQHGLKERKQLEWATDMLLMSGPLQGVATVKAANGVCASVASTTYWDHYRRPPVKALVRERRAVDKIFKVGDGEAQPIDPSKVQMPECRYPLAILPTLPLDPPYRIKRPAVSPDQSSQCKIPNPVL